MLGILNQLSSMGHSKSFRFGLCIALSVGLAGAAELVHPSSIAVDEKGNIYIADPEACTILRLDAGQGALAIVAQGECHPRTPLYSLTAVAAAQSGAVAFSDTGTSNVYRITAGKAIPSAAPDSKSLFGIPAGLAFDTAGNLIVADLGVNAVLRVSGDQVVTLVSVEAPSGVCVDKAGGIVVVSASKRRLVRVGPGGKVTTIAEGPPFEFPLAVTAAGDGSYVIADGYAAAIFKVSPDGRVSVLAKGGLLKYPSGVAAEPSGAFVVVDPQAKAVFRVSPHGEVSTVHTSK